ncbi:c-type cytochrome [Rhodomicrobium lacus]|uniref:c-type cytochrome n=1 Tax=Rhodomicrobium lacus TaxID=2498452 RepID=UPI000F8DDE18|nr:hypothetical protein [Rhodomicrobium lacus]
MRYLGLIAGLMAGGMFFACTQPTLAQAETDVSVLAGTCTNCHGSNKNWKGVIPGLAGRPEPILLGLLKSYKAGDPNATVMSRIARGYSEDDLQAIANYYSKIKK